MPPKRKAEGTAAELPARVTRLASKRAADAAAAEVAEESRKKKATKAKVVKKQKKNKDEKGNDDVLVEEENEEEAEEKVKDEEKEAENVVDASNKNIVVEHCKQCTQFKKRAILVKEGLEKAELGLTVKLNPDKPRRGCFEIRQEGGGKKFISLLDMKRPFKRMKDLDLDKVISDIVDEISKAS